jgi:hypothetical protein
MSAAQLTAIELLRGGLTITSTSTPALNGAYGVETDMLRGAMQAEINSLLLNSNTFVDGSTSVSWPDKTGASHNFSETEFRAFVNAVDQFVAQCFQYGAGVISTAPAATATIA